MEYVYGALLLHKLGQPVNEGNLKKVIAATGVEVDEAKVKTLIASLKGVDIASELKNASAIATAPAYILLFQGYKRFCRKHQSNNCRCTPRIPDPDLGPGPVRRIW